MAQVTLHETQQQAALDENKLVDSKGRVIRLRELDPLQESRLILAVGAEAAMNIAYLNAYVLPVAMVEYINEDYFGCPQSQGQIDGTLKILGREGLLAIMEHLQDKADQVDEEAEKAAIKN